jgi:hypothetical protein
MNNANVKSIWLINNRTNEFSKINLVTISFLKNQVSSTHVREASRAFRPARGGNFLKKYLPCLNLTAAAMVAKVGWYLVL